MPKQMTMRLNSLYANNINIVTEIWSNRRNSIGYLVENM